MKKLGVLSDTHGNLADTLRAVALFRDRGVSTIVHCGDIGGEGIVRAFEGIETHFVYGNMDGENERLRRAAEETGNTLHGWFGSIELEGRRIAFLHGHRGDRFEQEAGSGNWDLLCYGHTHFPALQQRGGTLLLNPGAFQRVAVPRIAVVLLPELTVEGLTVEPLPPGVRG